MLRSLYKVLTKTQLRKLILFILISAYSLYRFWPTPIEKQLRRELDILVKQTTLAAPLEAVETMLRASDIVQILADTVHLEYRSSEDEFSKTFSRADALKVLTSGIGRVRKSTVGYSLFRVLTSNSSHVSVRFLLIAEWNENERAAEDVQLDFLWQDGRWRIVGMQTFPRVTL
jgi:hypothetical protein